MRTLALLAAASSALVLGAWCPEDARTAIAEALARSLEATRNEDIDAYMALVPPDLLLKQDDGSTTTRDQLRADVLQQWSIIDRTLAIEAVIDRMERNPDGSWTVWTSQRWERVMIGRDGKSRHNIVTTQKHREVWRCYGDRWFNYEIEELGGQLWIDGELQQRGGQA